MSAVSSASDRPPWSRAERRVFGLLLGLGAAARLYAAWTMRHHLNIHAGTVALMTRHIALGKEFPTFYYGQSHMGSQEAWLGALFALVLGPSSGLAVSLGAAVVAILLLPMVYVWARDIAGPQAGAAAAAFLVIGPWGLFHYGGSPRTSYQTMLVCGAFSLWIASRIVLRWRRERMLRHRDFLGLGLAAGLAWWGGQLTAPAIFTAALFLLLGLRGGVFTWKLASGLAGFLAGSAPFWIYNVRHGWPTLAFRGTFGRVSFREALVRYFPARFDALLIPGEPAFLRPVAAVIVVGAMASALLLGLGALPGGRRSARLHPGLLVSLLFLPVFATVFGLSHFSAINAPRYLFPLIPILAVHLGVLTAWLGDRMPRPAAWIPVLLLIAMQTPVLSWAWRHEAFERASVGHLREMADGLRDDPPGALYATHTRHPWNFVLEEEFVFSTFEGDVYAPNQRRAEEADTVAFVEGYGDLGGFLTATGTEAESIRPGGIRIHLPPRPPEPRRVPLDPERIRDATDHRGQSALDLITDLRPDTAWTSRSLTGEEALELRFDGPVAIAGVRVLSLDYVALPRSWSVEGASAGGTWTELLPRTSVSLLFWSGPRPFWSYPFFRLEAYFEPTEVTALRIRGRHRNETRSWSIHLVQPLVAAEGTTPEPDLPALARLLGDRGILRLYTDRWEGPRVHEASGGTVWTPRHPALYPSEDPPDAVRITPDTAFLVRAGEVDLTIRTLTSRGLSARQTPVGPWVLIDADPDEPWTHDGADAGMVWTGFGLLAGPVPYAPVRVRRAASRFGEDPADPAILEDLNAALAANPWLHEARELRVRVHDALGDMEAAARERGRIEAATRPPRPAEIRFPRGIRFLGYGLDRDTARPGETVAITYFWEAGPRIEARHLAVFVHMLRDGQVAFQDDHVFLEDLPDLLQHPPPDGVIRIDREVRIPEDAAPGPVEIVLGLYDRRSGDRLRPRTDLPVRRRHAPVLPPGPGRDHPLEIAP